MIANPLNPLLATGAVTVGEPRLVPFATHPCLCVSRHVPTIKHTVRHHIIPKAWNGPDTAENIVNICPNTHSETHRLLEAFVRNGGPLPRIGYNDLVWSLTLRAWEGRPVQ